MTSFGPLLRDWRTQRGLSQLEVASRAEVSQRHLSHLETGKSRPSREMVIHLGITLDVPLREQNLLLVAAGHAPEFPETAIEDLGHLTSVLDEMLAAHEPNMALILDRRWNVIRSNDGARRFASIAFPEPPSWLEPPLNLARLSLHPQGLRQIMPEWERSGAALLRRLVRDAAMRPHDRTLQDLLEEVRAYPGVAELESGHRAAMPDDLLLTMRYDLGGRDIRLFSTIAVVGDAHDLTLDELRIETFWPADGASERHWREMIAS